MKIEVKVSNALTEIERGLAVPVIEIAQQLALEMYQRIHDGRAATGTFRELGKGSVTLPGNSLFWVNPKRPQPAGYVAKATEGKWAGWVGYVSYKAYCEALGSPPRNFRQTGQLMHSMRVRAMGPGRVKIAFYGGRKQQPQPTSVGPYRFNNANIAWLASRFERDPMLMPTLAEIRRVRDAVLRHFTELVESASAQGAKSRRRKAWTPRARR